MPSAVLYNGAKRRKTAVDVRDLISLVGSLPAPCQPSQRYRVLDARHLGKDDLPVNNVMAAMIALDQIRSPADVVWVVDVLRKLPQDPRDG